MRGPLKIAAAAVLCAAAAYLVRAAARDAAVESEAVRRAGFYTAMPEAWRGR